MFSEGIDFLIKGYCEFDRFELVDRLNSTLSTDFSSRGGEYLDRFVEIAPFAFYDPTQPIDFDADDDNYQWEISVSLSGQPTWERAVEQVDLARKFKAALDAIGCQTRFVFTFGMPDGTDPATLLNDD